MNDPSTLHVGPLGSTVHVLRAGAATIADLAAIDRSRYFRRVSLDPARGLITLMSPSRLHEDLNETLGAVAKMAADALGRTSKGLLATRLRPRGSAASHASISSTRNRCNFPGSTGAGKVGSSWRTSQSSLRETPGRSATSARVSRTGAGPTFGGSVRHPSLCRVLLLGDRGPK